MDLDTDDLSLRKGFFDQAMAGRNVTPISAIEQKMVAQVPLLSKIESFHKIRLSSFIFDNKNYISPHDAIQFLIDSFQKGLDGYAIDIMETCHREKRKLSYDDLMEALIIVATGMRTPMITVQLLGKEAATQEDNKWNSKRSIEVGKLRI